MFFSRGEAVTAGAKIALQGFFRAEWGDGAARKEAGEIPPYATRRAKIARKKKPGRSDRNDKKRPANVAAEAATS